MDLFFFLVKMSESHYPYSHILCHLIPSFTKGIDEVQHVYSSYCCFESLSYFQSIPKIYASLISNIFKSFPKYQESFVLLCLPWWSIRICRSHSFFNVYGWFSSNCKCYLTKWTKMNFFLICSPTHLHDYCFPFLLLNQ